MTTPTQAQIEAARKMLQLSSCFGKEVCPILPCACAETMAAITAAEEVGDKEFDPQDWLNDVERFRACMHRTIERCAQVAEAPKDIYGIGAEIAAAIRALKDKPAIDPNLVYPGKDPDFVFPEEN